MCERTHTHKCEHTHTLMWIRVLQDVRDSGQGWHRPLIPAFRMQRQSISEFETSLVYKTSSRQLELDRETMSLKQTNKQTNEVRGKKTKAFQIPNFWNVCSHLLWSQKINKKTSNSKIFIFSFFVSWEVHDKNINLVNFVIFFLL